MRSCRTPRRRSRFSVDGGKVGTPGSPIFLPAGSIPRDDSRRILSDASSRIRELISFQNVHCEIVHWLGSDLVTGICEELAGWPRQLGSSTGEVAAYPVELIHRVRCLSLSERLG